ncbi:MAG: hypothetical protein ACREV9_15275 [Burkholderiales bacterium]
MLDGLVVGPAVLDELDAEPGDDGFDVESAVVAGLFIPLCPV